MVTLPPPEVNTVGYLLLLFTSDFVGDPVVASKAANDAMHTFTSVPEGNYRGGVGLLRRRGKHPVDNHDGHRARKLISFVRRAEIALRIAHRIPNPD